MHKVITEQHVLTKSKAKDKETVLYEISEQAFKLGIVENKDSVYKALIERESEVSTGFTDGFAIPHTRNDSVTHVALIVSRLETGINWPSMDGTETDFVIAILVPEKNDDKVHLQILSKLSRSLMKADFRNKLKSSDNSREIYESINEIIKETKDE